MCKIRTALLLCGLTGAVRANEVSAREAYFTGPLITPSAATLPMGVLNVEPYLIDTKSNAMYDNHGHRHANPPASDQWSLAIPVMFGISDRLTAQITAGVARNTSGGSHSDGARLLDSTAKLQYLLAAPHADGTGAAVSMVYAHRFPSGAYDHLGDNPLNGMGCGTSIDTFSLLAQRLFWLGDAHPLRWRGQIAWSPAPARLDVHSISTYNTSANFHGTVQAGSAITASTSLEYGLDRHWALAVDLVWVHQNESRLRGVECILGPACAPVARRDPVHWDYSVSQAIEYNMSASMGLIVGAQIPLAGHQSHAYVAPQVALNMSF